MIASLLRYVRMLLYVCVLSLRTYNAYA